MVTIMDNNCRLDAKQILKSLKPFRKPSVFLCLRRDQKGTLRRKGLKKVRKDLNSPMKMIQILSKKTTRIPSPKRCHIDSQEISLDFDPVFEKR